ncbi:MAG TPA: FAD-binding oxidoreductase [Balneolales bacterium]|nr:FAD-binding oxidoreductase [Balneolales bacterium]
MINSVSSEINLPEVQMNLYKPKNPVDVPIVENRIATIGRSPNFVRHITFDVSGTMLEGNIKVGQSIGIVPPGTRENSRPHKLRLYSVSSPTNGEEGEGKLVSTIVKRVIEENPENNDLFLGVCSNYLCSLQVGDMVKMTGPSGRRFLLPDNPQNYNYVFFATGTGIAPYRGMIMDLMRKGVTSDIILIFGAPYRTDLLYAEYFHPLSREKKNFHYLTSISREDPRADGTKYYVQYQIIDRADLMVPILEKDNTLIYICGLKGMETGIYQLLAQSGISGYCDIAEELKSKDAFEWTDDEIKSGVKPTDRVFLEVY